MNDLEEELIIPYSYEEEQEGITNDYYYEEDSLTLDEVINYCISPSISSIQFILTKLIVLNFVLGILKPILRLKLYSLLSIVFGLILLGDLEFSYEFKLIIFCFIFAYFLLLFSIFARKVLGVHNTTFVKLVTIALLVGCEYAFPQPKSWLKIRGVMMILAMKTISMSQLVSASDRMPISPTLFFGYTLCPANCMFGPWCSFDEYVELVERSTITKLPKTLFRIFTLTLSSLFFLSVSNCWLGHLIPDQSNTFLVAFRDAFAFRSSHYFISYLSEMSMIAAGLHDISYAYQVTDPVRIELYPVSLALVVRRWNLPMHTFLKYHFYRSFLPYGKFIAIMITFFMSSLLHGFEFKVSFVLLGLGVYSYLQILIRNRIATISGCCVSITRCNACNHKYKGNNWRCVVLRVIFSVATQFHLVFFGMLMEPSTDVVGVYNKWKDLYFLSPVLLIFSYVFFNIIL